MPEMWGDLCEFFPEHFMPNGLDRILCADTTSESCRRLIATMLLLDLSDLAGGDKSIAAAQRWRFKGIARGRCDGLLALCGLLGLNPATVSQVALDPARRDEIVAALRRWESGELPEDPDPVPEPAPEPVDCDPFEPFDDPLDPDWRFRW